MDLFKEYSVEKEMEPDDYYQLKNSKKYNHILRTSKNMRERQIRWYIRAIRWRERAVESIKGELRGK